MRQRYTSVAVALHWLIAMGILFNLIAMFVVDDDARSRPFIDLHKSIGITVLLLVVARILWRIGHRPPPLLPAKPWEHRLATAAHHTLYLLMVLVPLSGWLMNSASLNKATGQPYGIDLFHLIPWFNLPGFAGMTPAQHEFWHHDVFGLMHAVVFKVLLWIVVIGHIAGALKHQFLDHQPEFRRMWFGRAERLPPQQP